VAEPLPNEVLDSAVKPTQVAQQTFELERRGFDQAQVRAFLIAVADSLRDAQSREAEIRTRLGRAIRRAEEAEAAMRDGVSSDPGELTRQLGDEVATVLDAARAAGQQRIMAAEKSAEQLLTNAKSEASDLRHAAETIMDERRADADAAAADILNECEAEADQIREKARGDADVMRKDAAGDVERARNECESLVREAEAVRTQILEDMERRRRQSRAQVERLRVGRDRLLRSYDIVRRTLDESTGELKSSLREAKVLGDTAARKVAAEPLASPGQLEEELAAKRLLTARSTTTPVVEDEVVEEPQAELPVVDLRPGNGASVRPFTEVVAPTPRRPAELPKPPAVAPTIKVESATPVVAEPVDEPAAEDSVAEDSVTTDSVTTDSVTTDPVVEESVPEDSVVEQPVADAIDTEDQTDDEPIDLSGLPEGELDVVEPNDEVEQVVALAAVVDGEGTSPALVETEAPAPIATEEPTEDAEPQSSGLFDALREQKQPTAKAKPATKVEKAPAKSTKSKKAKKPKASTAKKTPKKTAKAASAKVDRRAAAMAKQRDAIVAEVSASIEKRLKRGLADEQNDVLAGIRSAGKPRRGRKATPLISMVGETDDHLNRYVVAISEVAATAYAAGAALIDGEASPTEMPAGAVEELVATQVVVPQRLHLIELDQVEVEEPAIHLDAVRAFYRTRKNNDLAPVAESLGALLVTAGACDALGEDGVLPWLPKTS
jgi:cell division septum initiation protein DivIVA